MNAQSARQPSELVPSVVSMKNAASHFHHRAGRRYTMSTREVAELASRILALTLLCFSLFDVVAIVGLCLLSVERAFHAHSLGDVSNLGLGLVVYGIPIGLKLVMIWFLWTRADWVAQQIVPSPSTHSRWPRLRAADMQVAAFSCVGLVFLCWGVRNICALVAMVLFEPFRGYSDTMLGDLIRSEPFIAALANVVIGTWLLLGSRGVVRWIRRLRQLETAEVVGQTTDSADLKQADR